MAEPNKNNEKKRYGWSQCMDHGKGKPRGIHTDATESEW